MGGRVCMCRSIQQPLSVFHFHFCIDLNIRNIMVVMFVPKTLKR